MLIKMIMTWAQGQWTTTAHTQPEPGRWDARLGEQLGLISFFVVCIINVLSSSLKPTFIYIYRHRSRRHCVNPFTTQLCHPTLCSVSKQMMSECSNIKRDLFPSFCITELLFVVVVASSLLFPTVNLVHPSTFPIQLLQLCGDGGWCHYRCCCFES